MLLLDTSVLYYLSIYVIFMVLIREQKVIEVISGHSNDWDEPQKLMGPWRQYDRQFACLKDEEVPQLLIP